MAVLTKLQKQKKKTNSLKDRWRTPLWLFKAAQALVGRIATVDVACDHTNALCHRFLTIEDNALVCDWGEADDVAWCNCPYSSIAPWIVKAIEQQRRGVSSILLLPANKDTKWFLLAYEFCVTYEVIGKRVQFDKANVYENENPDQKKSSNTGGSMILFFDGNQLASNTQRIVPVKYHDLYELGMSHVHG